MNTANKGYKKEKMCRDILKEEGWLIPFQSVRTRWATYDYADLFDVVAYKEKSRKFISLKHFGNSNYYLPHQNDIKEFKNKFGLEGESYELWMWKSPRWVGRGKNKQWFKGDFIKLTL